MAAPLAAEVESPRRRDQGRGRRARAGERLPALSR
jgi:hypothetical protein